jgi:hypothetical protein
MEKTMIFVVATLMSVMLFNWSRAQSPELPENAPDSLRAYRLDEVHYDAVANIVEWSVVGGTLDSSGHFKPSDVPAVVYSLNLETGEMTRDGVKGNVDPRNEHEAVVFDSLSLLMQEYTKKWDDAAEPSDPEPGLQDVIKVAQ